MPKLVRKSQANWQSIVLDWYLELSENIGLMDWDYLATRWTIPVGVIVNMLHWLACVQASYLQRTIDGSVFVTPGTSSKAATGQGSQWWLHTMRMTSLVFILISVFNTWYCFTREKEYQIKKPNDPWSESSSTNLFSTPQKPTSQGDSSSFYDRITTHLKPPKAPDATSGVVTLLAWSPPKPALRCFAIFSPVHAILTWSMPRNPSIFVFLPLLSFQSLYLISMFERHVDDKKMIYGQVFSEYESSFVQPRLGVMKRDVGVGTRPDDNGVYVEVHTPKVGIVDASKVVPGIPRSASQIKMHDWERPVSAKPFPTSPNVWAQSPLKPGPSVRRTISSPNKINGSPAKMFKPAGWGSGSFNSNPFVQHQNENGGMKKSKTMSSLSNQWD